ncbi:hypothetical protein B0H11DRAFT_1034663 [Mycena galericulata]|nr:hypothetical protein B0H11DRAFT_1034663 [Mycena galericulata]
MRCSTVSFRAPVGASWIVDDSMGPRRSCMKNHCQPLRYKRAIRSSCCPNTYFLSTLMKSAFALIVLASLFLSSLVSAFPILINHNPTLVSRASLEHVPFYWKSQEVEEADTGATNDLAAEGRDTAGKQSPTDNQHVPFFWKSKEVEEADTVATNDLAAEGRDTSGKQSPTDNQHVPFFWKSKE